MKKLIEIVEASTRGQKVHVTVHNDNSIEILCPTRQRKGDNLLDLVITIEPTDLEVSKEIFDEEIFDEEKNNLYVVTIQTSDVENTTIRDIESIIAKANWFISDTDIKLHVLDMPDGVTCLMTLEVLNRTEPEPTAKPGEMLLVLALNALKI